LYVALTRAPKSLTIVSDLPTLVPCATSEHWFHHTLGDIFGAVIETGFTVVWFEERDNDVSTIFGGLARSQLKVPMSYLLEAVATGQGTASPKAV
jgi:hypothetical protein